MKYCKYILIIIIWIGLSNEVLSQYYLKTKHDSIPMESDSVLLDIDEYRGTIRWEVSYDTITWYDLRQLNDEFLIRILSNGMYRAIVTDNTCNLIYSDTVYLGKKDLDILQFELEIDSSSIQYFKIEDSTETTILYQLSNGVRFNFTIPANLRSNPDFDTITIQEVKRILNYPEGFYYNGAVQILPDGARFLKPINLTIEIPFYYYENVDNAFAFTTITKDNLFYPLNICDIKGPENGYYTINTDIHHFCSIGAGEGAFSDCNQYALFQSGDDFVGYFGSVFNLIGETSEEVINYLRPLYLHWYNTIVVPSIKGSSSLAELELATSELYEWYTDGFYRFFEDEFDILLNQAINLIGEKVMGLVNPLNDGCIKKNDICSKKDDLEAYYEIYSFVLNTPFGEIENFPAEDEFCNNIVELVVNDIESSNSIVLIEKNKVRELDLVCKSFQNVVISDPDLIYEIKDKTIVNMISPGKFKGLQYGETEITALFCDVSETVKVKVGCSLNTDTVTDIDGNIYPTETIGTQVWMAENLRTKKFNDGTPIPFIQDYELWYSNAEDSQAPAYCWIYGVEPPDLFAARGPLYNWYTVETKKLCPAGWHVPSLDEYFKLIEFIGGPENGGKLKENRPYSEWGTSEWWSSPNTGATNEFCFSALPGGIRDAAWAAYWNWGSSKYGFWWTADGSEFVDSDGHKKHADCVKLSYDTGLAEWGGNFKGAGMSVRCVKD